MPVLVVLPTYNEADNIVEVLSRVREALPEGRVLVVDDGSPDGTADLAEGWAAAHGGVDVLRRSAKGGLGPAYKAGFRWGLDAGFDVLIEMDSDLSHDPAKLPALVAEVERGASLAIGSRYVAGGSTPDWPWHRQAVSRGGNRYASLALGLPVRDLTAGFRAYAAPALEAIDLEVIGAEGYAFQIEMAYAVLLAGGEVVEVPIAFTDRLRGESKMSGRIVWEAMGLVTWWGIRDRILRPLRARVRGRRRAVPGERSADAPPAREATGGA